MLAAMEPETTPPIGMAAIAAAAGVAVSTVSRALSGTAGVSAAKRAQILAIARSTGYLSDESGGRPERRASLENARITAVIPEPDRWVFGSILAGLHDMLTPPGPSLTVYQGFSGGQRARIFSSASLARQADVLVLVPMPRGVPIEDVTGIGLPVVVAGSVVPGLASVGIDDVVVGRKSTNYLINTGFRRIAYASYTDHEGTPGNASRRRAKGFVASMQRAGLDPSWQVQVPFGPDAGRAAAESLLEGDRLPEALVVCSDEMAAGMMAVFRRAGVRIPEDLAIIGVDNHPVAEMVSLTTIAQPARQQGQMAATMALQALQGTLVPEAVTLPTHLIVRESTRRSSGAL